MPDDVKRPLKVFLCQSAPQGYARDDKPKVRELYRYLKRRGLQPWLDAEDLLPGQAWQVGEGDYLEIRKQLFKKETVASLYEQVEAFQKAKK